MRDLVRLFSPLRRGESGSLTSFTAPQDGLLQPHKVYCRLPKVYCSRPKVYCSLTRFTAVSQALLQPHKVYCSLTRFTAGKKERNGNFRYY